MTTYEEWRVTGTGVVVEIVWSKQRGHANPEASARAFIERELKYAPTLWTDGPHLHKRTVTVTDWEAVA